MEIYKVLALIVTLMALFVGETKAQQVPGVNSQVMACMQRLLPCQPYIHKVNPPPPPSCCLPLKEIVEKDAPCLCSVFNNPEMLKALNLTKENALDLPKACGAKPDVSLCNNKTASSPPTQSPASTNGGSSLHAISFNGLSFVSAFVAMIFL